MKKAHELYYLVNGSYIADMTKLDWDFKENCNLSGNDIVACDKYFMMDLLSGSGVITNPTLSYIRIYYCPGYQNWSQCSTAGNYKFLYRVWLDRSSYPRKRECTGTMDEAKSYVKYLLFNNLYCSFYAASKRKKR
ncbi:MAG: hypothetical protein LBG16_01940 [Elusimicrobiota bacterium]|nr:hypothetical protein [Elusimicrobiota bacterium]